jgi:hydrogenase-1 operon protein HyaF
MQLHPDSEQPQPGPEMPTHNTGPLLNEIRHALQRLIDTGETTIIDLRSIPLTDAEEQSLEQVLGAGEVECTLNTLGKSTIRETGISGVWLVSHYNLDEELLARSIEITTIPAILPSDEEAMREGLASIATLLEE